MKYQKRHQGKRRRQVSSRVEKALRRWVRQEAARYGVSCSYVIADAISRASGIPIETYRPAEVLRVLRGGRR